MSILRVLAFILFIDYTVGELNLTIVHISDFHSHWFEFDESRGECSDVESENGKCYGGFPRLISFIRRIRERESNVLVLSSGEFFLGRSLHPLDGWRMAQALLPRLGLDAMSLSNHDFDNGILELSAFLYSIEFPVLCANMWAKKSSYLHSRINKSIIMDVAGEKIGVVGYLHRHALKKSHNAISIRLLPEIPALQEEVRRLEKEGVNKIIALGHAGYDTDLEIVQKVKGVDVVIGGDSDIVLEDPGDGVDKSLLAGNIYGNYPRVHEHNDPAANEKNKTLVLHVPRYGRYVGVVRVRFDDHGRAIAESGEAVPLDNQISQNSETLNFLLNARKSLEKLSEHKRLPSAEQVLANTSGHLDGEPRNCRRWECTLGNLIADALLYEFTHHYNNGEEYRYFTEKWGPIDAVIVNSGIFVRSIEPGNIYIGDILRSVSLGDRIKRVHMLGQDLLDTMENSVKHYDSRGVTSPGAFLQVAGLRVKYDLKQKPGRRVRSLLIRCRHNGTFHTVNPHKTYVIGMPTFIMIGRDGFKEFSDLDEEDYGQFDALLIVEYLRRMYYINPVLDGRIKFHRQDSENSESAPQQIKPTLATEAKKFGVFKRTEDHSSGHIASLFPDRKEFISSP